MKKISAFLVSIFMLFAFTTTAINAQDFDAQTEEEAIQEEVIDEEEAVIEESDEEILEETTVEETTVEETTDSLQMRANQQGENEVPVNNVTSSIADIPSDYWASMEINSVINDGIMTLYDDGTFAPDVVVRRVDFAKWVLNALDNSTFQITVQNNYSDVDETTDGYEAILRNDQLGLIYGYPDGTFQPDRIITKAETNSIMSHITKDKLSADF